MKLFKFNKSGNYIKRKTIISLVSMFVFLNSCTKEKAGYTIPDDKLVEIIADIHISESAVQHLTIAKRDSMAKVYLYQILEIHEVQKPIFEQEYQQLKRDPKKLQVVYAKIVTKLNDMKKIKKAEKEKGKAHSPKKK